MASADEETDVCISVASRIIEGKKLAVSIENCDSVHSHVNDEECFYCGSCGVSQAELGKKFPHGWMWERCVNSLQ